MICYSLHFTADLLALLTEYISKVLDKRDESRSVALDISKAFDRVWHAGLLHKLSSYGIQDEFLSLIASFLSNRSMSVVVNGCHSQPCSVNAGVPQGYILKVKHEILKAKLLWVERQRQTSKGMWNVVSEVRGKRCKDPVSTLLQEYPNVQELLQHLTSEFIGNFNSEEDVQLQSLDDVPWNFFISPENVLQKLKQINPRKAVGPDLIHAKLLIVSAHLICKPLSAIFNRSISCKSFPSAFKFGFVYPVPKKPKPSVKDFRPISILPVLGKVFEKLVLERVRDDLIACYNPHQHAYRPHGSTTSALIDIHDHVTKLLDLKSTQAVRMICLDLSKAFDGLQFHRLVNFLNTKGVDHGFLGWLTSYLTSRQFRVKTKGALGPLVKIQSGVPQGSVLGPYLFAAFMGCIDFDVYNVFSVQYADDVTLIESLNVGKPDVISLAYIASQFSNAGLKLNSQKCKQI